MLQLYKSRDFGLNFKDTFAFLRAHGKHFFQNFVKVNVFFILALLVLSYIFETQQYNIFSDGKIQINDFRLLSNYFDNNTAIEILIGIVSSLVTLFISILIYAFVPIYFKLYEQHKGANFQAKEITTELMRNLTRLVYFSLASIVILIPAMIFVFIVTFLLTITYVGVLLIIFVVGLVFFFYHTALSECIKYNKKGVFQCFNYSFDMCFQKFFPTVGAIGIFIFIVVLLQSIFAFAQGFLIGFYGFESAMNPYGFSEFSQWSALHIIMFILQILTYLFSFICTAILQMHLSIVYYGLKEEKENINTQNTIDQIGSAKG